LKSNAYIQFFKIYLYYSRNIFSFTRLIMYWTLVHYNPLNQICN